MVFSENLSHTIWDIFTICITTGSFPHSFFCWNRTCDVTSSSTSVSLRLSFVLFSFRFYFRFQLPLLSWVAEWLPPERPFSYTATKDKIQYKTNLYSSRITRAYNYISYRTVVELLFVSLHTSYSTIATFVASNVDALLLSVFFHWWLWPRLLHAIMHLPLSCW